MNTKPPELLSPAGGMESAVAAINAGADAIYLGGKNFSARSSAQNFTDDEITGLIEFAAVRNVRVYIAVNTLYKNAEMPQVLEFVTRMHNEGAAAFILQDAGLAYILKENFPQIEIHASTQMSVHSTEGVHYMEKMGFSRVVLARELSLAEIAEINAAVRIETEVFVHGALCISYSGQCLMSSLIGGRSGNRGKCAQICRTKYALMETVAESPQTGVKCRHDSGSLPFANTKCGHSAGVDPVSVRHSGYLLSPKDMMTLDILDKITATGVASLKIEGRMKSPEYVYLVTKAYRGRLDALGMAHAHRHNNFDVVAPVFGHPQAAKQVNAQYGDIRPGVAKSPALAPTVAANKQNLLQIFNRGGSFSTGYYQTYAGPEMMSTITPKSTGVLIGDVTSYTKGKCKIKFVVQVNPGDGIEIWTSDGNHVGTGISKIIAKGESAEFSIKGAIEKGNSVYKSYDHGLISATKKEMSVVSKKRMVYATVRAIVGEPLSLTLDVVNVSRAAMLPAPNSATFSRDSDGSGSLSCDCVKVRVHGDVVEAAKSAPMPKEEIFAQLSKTGNTPFEIDFTHAYNRAVTTRKASTAPNVNVSCVASLATTGENSFCYNSIDENIFISRGALNQLRRRALEELETKIVQSIKPRDIIDAPNRPLAKLPEARENVSELGAVSIAARTFTTSDANGSRTASGSVCTCVNEPGKKSGDLMADTSRSDCPQVANSQKLSVQLSNINHLPAVMRQNISRIYIPVAWASSSKYGRSSYQELPAPAESILPMERHPNTEIFITLPPISRNSTDAKLKAAITQWESTNIDGYLVSTYGQLSMLQSTSKKIMLNHTFNIFNSYAQEAFANMEVTLSQELNTIEIKSGFLPFSITDTCQHNVIKSNADEACIRELTHEVSPGSFELIVYGRQTLMATHNCPLGLYLDKSNKHCHKNEKAKQLLKSQPGHVAGSALRDKMNMHFPIQTDCNTCIAYILNSKVLDTAQKFHAIKSTGAASFRLVFTDESEKTICDIIDRYKKALAGEKTTTHGQDTTYGHFFRGVE